MSKAPPGAVLAPVHQSPNQSHNSIPSSERSGSQIRPWKSGSMWIFRPGLLLNPHPFPHLEPRITGQPFRVNTRMLLFIFFPLEHTKITARPTYLCELLRSWTETCLHDRTKAIPHVTAEMRCPLRGKWRPSSISGMLMEGRSGHLSTLSYTCQMGLLI